MANGVLIMDNDDWVRIENLFDKLPCASHTENITILLAQRDAAKEQLKAMRESKDWLLKGILGAIVLFEFLQALGVFRTLAK